MKKLLFAASMLACTYAANSQQLTFNINQSGASYKNRVGQYEEAQLKDANITIKMQNQVVQVMDDNASSIKLEKIEQQKKVNMYTYSQVGYGKDASNNPVTFKFTINTKSKQAVVELTGKGAKNYYFGTCNYDEKLSKL